MQNKQSIIRRYFDSFRSADRQVVDQLLCSDFTFTSPYDDHIDRETYFERCWQPMAGTFQHHDLQLVMVEGDDAVVHYDAQSKDGATFRNVERFAFDGEQIRSVEVFFGLPSGAAAVEPHDAIKTVIKQRNEALKVKDARLVAAKHADRTVAFTLAPPLVAEGESEDGLKEWFKTWQGPIDWETRDPEIAVSGDVGFVSALERMAGVKTSGEHVDMWFRTTLGLCKVRGEWKILHEHQSVPFYMDGSLRAAVDLTPDHPMGSASGGRQPSTDRYAPH